MGQGGLRPCHDLVPGFIGAPPEVHPVAVQWQFRCQAAELAPHVAADQHSGRGTTQDGLRDLLPLVDVPVVDDGHAPPRPSNRLPDLGECLRIVAATRLEQLRVQDGRPRSGRSLQQLPQSVGTRSRIVVQQPDPRRVRRYRSGYRCAETKGPVAIQHTADDPRRTSLLQQLPGRIG